MDSRIWQSPKTFEWLQPRFSGSYVLTTGGGELGKMSQPSSLSSVWYGESDFGRWRFEGAGFWSRRYEIRDLDTELLLGTYTMKWHAAEGTLTLADGQTIHWQQTSWFKGRSAFTDAQGREVVRVEMGRESGEGKISDLFLDARQGLHSAGWSPGLDGGPARLFRLVSGHRPARGGGRRC